MSDIFYEEPELNLVAAITSQQLAAKLKDKI
jgi:hypothetical protein